MSQQSAEKIFDFRIGDADTPNLRLSARPSASRGSVRRTPTGAWEPVATPGAAWTIRSQELPAAKTLLLAAYERFVPASAGTLVMQYEPEGIKPASNLLLEAAGLAVRLAATIPSALMPTCAMKVRPPVVNTGLWDREFDGCIAEALEVLPGSEHVNGLYTVPLGSISYLASGIESPEGFTLR